MKKTLAETNPYIRSAEDRLRIIIRNSLQSSILEGARGLRVDSFQEALAKARASARSKKAHNSA